MARSKAVVVGLFIVVGVTIAPMAGSHVAPWQTRNAYWLPAPADIADHLFALKVETVGADGLLQGTHGSISFSPPAGIAVDDIAALRFDAYYEQGGCGGGSPRLNLRVDQDADGDVDFFVLAYVGDVPSFVNCAQGVWTTHRLLTDPGPRWFVPGLGYAEKAAAFAYLAASFPDHQVTRVDLQWDSTWLFGPSVTWFDNIFVHDHSLREPVPEVWCPATVEPGIGPCPFVLVP